MNNVVTAFKGDFDVYGFVILENNFKFGGTRKFAQKYEADDVWSRLNPSGTSSQLNVFWAAASNVRNNSQWCEGVLAPEECGDTIRQINDLILFDSAFADLICRPRLLDVLEILFESS